MAIRRKSQNHFSPVLFEKGSLFTARIQVPSFGQICEDVRVEKRAPDSPSQGPLESGPLVGEVASGTARIWARGRDESQLVLTLFGAEGATQFFATPRNEEWRCATFEISGLQSDAHYEYAIASQHGTTAKFPLPGGIPHNAKRARIAFGSCIHDVFEPQLPIFDAIAREHADALVLLGDNCYFDETDCASEDGMMNAHLRTRAQPNFAQLVQKTPTLAIYDDHDFGPNDADGNFAGRERALAAFKRVWAQSAYGTAQTAGIFSAVRIGPCELFLTDGRYHRNVGRPTVLGSAQQDWLCERLLRSEASVKIIASGTTVLAHHPFYHDWESWRRTASDDLEALLCAIEQHDIRGVIFISGDLHMGQARCIKGRSLGAQKGPDFWELTSSPLAMDPYNEHVIWPEGPLIAQVPDRQNYGLIEIDLDRKDAEVLLFLKGSAGEVLFRQPVEISTLRVR